MGKPTNALKSVWADSFSWIYHELTFMTWKLLPSTKCCANIDSYYSAGVNLTDESGQSWTLLINLWFFAEMRTLSRLWLGNIYQMQTRVGEGLIKVICSKGNTNTQIRMQKYQYGDTNTHLSRQTRGGEGLIKMVSSKQSPPFCGPFSFGVILACLGSF